MGSSAPQRTAVRPAGWPEESGSKLPHSKLRTAPTLAKLVNRHGQDDDRARDHLLPEGRHPQQVAAVGNQANQERTGNRAGYGSLTAREAGATNHHGSDDRQLITLTRGRLACHEP